VALHVTIAEVQSWLDAGKLELPATDTLPEEFNVSTYVLAKLGQIYNVATWVDNATTPNLVRVVISAKVAANRYNKLYSEEDDAGNKYANKLEVWAESIITALLNGTIVLVDYPTPITANDPAYYPNDLTGSDTIVDALGFIVGAGAGSEDIKFRMGDRY
jgi:hypothetical protein